VLNPVGAEEKQKILAAVNRLRPQGSTNAEAGLKLGYQMVINSQRAGAINRVILCSDGVANVGATSPEAILRTVKRYVEEGVTLSTIGFGMGNYNDKLMERLADTGNGNYAYVDGLDEARRVFGEQLTGTIQTVAKDAKIQVEFDARNVRYYRLIGYENREVADKDFRNDQVDAGEVGAGHAVTALYELRVTRGAEGKLATVRVRHEDPDTTKVTEVHQTITTEDLTASFQQAGASLRLAASVAEFAEVLRGASEVGELSLVESHLSRLVTDFDGEKRVSELLELVRKARGIRGR
jgi:Ca-activated chloride channel family protein